MFDQVVAELQVAFPPADVRPLDEVDVLRAPSRAHLVEDASQRLFVLQLGDVLVADGREGFYAGGRVGEHPHPHH
jgi:hypothetical protein